MLLLFHGNANLLEVEKKDNNNNTKCNTILHLFIITL